MKNFARLSFALLLLSPYFANAQHTAETNAAHTSAAAEGNQFDFLLGQWDVQVHPKISSLAAMIHGSPKLVGTWKAWRAADGASIEDELRIVDASGNPISLSRASRVYAPADARWKISGIDVLRGRKSEASGRWQNGEMRFEGNATDAEGKPTVTRTRYIDITPDSFRMQQDRSADNGQTWDEGVLTIDAKRTAATATP